MQTASKKIVNGWAMYDWANSVYNLVITTTFFPAYYAAVTSIKNFPDGIKLFGRNFVNTELKDYVLATGFLLIALLSPILSSIADYKGNKKNFMRFFCYLGAISCSLMFFFDKNNVMLGLVCFMFAGIGFYGSQVFYNSYLPEIASEEDMDRISAKGYTMGYIGSVLLQMIGFGLVVVMKEDPSPEKFWLTQTYKYWAHSCEISSCEDILNLSCPVYLSIGSKDDMIESSDALWQLIQEKKKTNITYARYEGLTHNMVDDKYTVFQDAASWLSKELGL